MTVSSGSFWTRTTASCLTSASSRYGRADIGTRCLSISVARASGRRGSDDSAARSRAASFDVSHRVVTAAREMPPSFRIRQKWTARKTAAMSGRKITCST